jgi:hypothetical protein
MKNGPIALLDAKVPAVATTMLFDMLFRCRWWMTC